MKKERFKFIPYYDVTNGSSTFKGKPCPSKEVIKLIGLKGLKKLDKKIKSLLQARVEMFGKRRNNLHGFSVTEFLYDTKKNIVFRIMEIIDNEGYSLNGGIEIPSKDIYSEKLREKGNYYVMVEDLYMSPKQYLDRLNLIHAGLIIESPD